MHCTNCGTEIKDGAKFCKSCGKFAGATPVVAEAVVTTPSMPTPDESLAIIKCGNCGYIGEGESARRILYTVLAWICVLVAPLITIIYFVGTHKYRCPKCKSTFLGIKNYEGVFVGQRGGAGKLVRNIILVLVGIAIMGILASIVLAALNSARQKSTGATSIVQDDGWQTYNSVADSFSILLPQYPTYENQTNTSGNVPYSYHTYAAKKDTASFDVLKYIYQNEIDTSDPDGLLERFLNAFVNGINGGQLVTSNYTNLGQYRALNFQVSSTADEDVKGMLVLVGQTPFLIVEDYFTQNYNDSDYQKFINSFSVK